MTSQRRGVTLLEIIIVITLMGIVSALALPRIRVADAGARLRSAGEIVASHATTARRAALARSAPTLLRVQADSVWVTMEREDGTSVVVARGVRMAEYQATLTLKNKTTDAEETSVRFDKRGIARGLNNQPRLLVLSSTYSTLKDTVCISGAGMVVRGGC